MMYYKTPKPLPILTFIILPKNYGRDVNNKKILYEITSEKDA